MFGKRGGRGGKIRVPSRYHHGGQFEHTQQYSNASHDSHEAFSSCNVQSSASSVNGISLPSIEEIIKQNSEINSTIKQMYNTLQNQAEYIKEFDVKLRSTIVNVQTLEEIVKKLFQAQLDFDSRFDENMRSSVELSQCLKGMVDGIMVRVDTLETNALSNEIDVDSKMKPLEDKTLTDAMTKEIENNVKELGSDIKFDVVDSVRRRNNLVFEKVPEGFEATKFIKELANELDIDGINDVTVCYARKWTSWPSSGAPKNMMCIKFRYEADKYKFLGKTVRDKLERLDGNHKFYGIKIYPDRSTAEMIQFKKLLKVTAVKNSELVAVNDHEHFWIVKHGRVLKVKKRTPVVGL